MGKTFEKQIKTIEDQSKKQVDALKVLEPKALESGSNNKPIITQEICDIEERMDEIVKMSEKIDFDRSVYNFQGPTTSVNFDKFGGPIYVHGHIKKGDITLQQAEREQKDLKKDLKRFKRNNMRKSET